MGLEAARALAGPGTHTPAIIAHTPQLQASWRAALGQSRYLGGWPGWVFAAHRLCQLEGQEGPQVVGGGGGLGLDGGEVVQSHAQLLECPEL